MQPSDGNRRRLPRFRLGALVRFESPSVQGTGSVINMSGGGLYIQCEEQPRVGEHVHIVFTCTQRSIEVDGETRWTSHGGAKLPGGFGLRIAQATEEYHTLVGALARKWTTRRTQVDRERRPSPRLAVSLPVVVEFGDLSEEARLCDISLSGARLEESEFHPPMGAEVVITFTFSLHAAAFEVIGRVIRHTEQGGFAVQFVSLDTALKDVIEAASQRARSLPSSS